MELILRQTGYIRAHALGKLKALCQGLGVERWRLGAQSGKCGLRGVLHRRLDHAVQTAQHSIHIQLRTSCEGCHEPAHHRQRGAAGLTDGPQTIA